MRETARSRGPARVFGALDLVVGGLVVAVGLNLAQFASIDARLPGGWKAVHPYDTSALDRGDFASKRYGIFLDIGRVAPGSTFIVPLPRPPTPTRKGSVQPRIYGLARVAEVIEVDYDPFDIGSGFDAWDFVVAEGDWEGSSGPYYWIAILDDEVSELVFLMLPDSRFVVTDIRLLRPEVAGVLRP